MKFLKPNEAATRFEQALIKLQIQWSAQGVVLHPGATSEQIVGFEKRHSVRLPDELRMVYLMFDGFSENSKMDDELFVLWPLDRVQRLNDYCEWKNPPISTRDRFIFADWSIDAWHYSVEMPPKAAVTSPVFIEYQENSSDRATDTVAEFFIRYSEGDVGVILANLAEHRPS